MGMNGLRDHRRKGKILVFCKHVQALIVPARDVEAPAQLESESLWNRQAVLVVEAMPVVAVK